MNRFFFTFPLLSTVYAIMIVTAGLKLIPECVPPPDMTKEYNIINREIGDTRNWGLAVLTRGYPIKEIEFENSHPGCAVAAEVEMPGITLTAVSVYGMPCKYNYATTTMHRILSD